MAEDGGPTGVRPSELRAGAPRAPEPAESIARRYAEMAHAFEPRPVDTVLRAFDVVISAALLLLLSPAIVLVAALILLTTGRPALYRGDRVGRAGSVFAMHKFRTLAPDAELRLAPYLGEELTKRTEAEVTPVGKVLRVMHLDEIPQLWDVLRGEMSVVGPRPIRPPFFEELCANVPQYWQRLVVRPGVTGFAQTRVTREATWEDKLAHDFEYIADRSVSLYFRVIATTGWRVVRRTWIGVRRRMARARGRPESG
jgi:lipopolysaccharide/colanic/teichoic acid biosynthesis glycosyltransferase